MDGRVITSEVESRAADLEAIEHDVGGANLHRVRAAIAAEMRGPGRVQAHGALNRERPAIEAGRHFDRGAVGSAGELRQQPGRPIRS